MSEPSEPAEPAPAVKLAPQSRYSDELAQKIATLVAVGVPIKDAAKVCGLAASTVMSWLKRGREGQEPFLSFVTAVEAGRAKYDAALAREVNSAARRDWRAAAWLLERRNPEYQRPGYQVQDANAVHTTISVLIRETGISREGIERAIQDGRIPVEALGTRPSGRHYIADHALAKQALLAGGDAIDTTGESVESGGGAPTPQSQVASMEQARIDRQRALAQKAQMEVAEKRGELVSRNEVQRTIDAALQSLSGQLLQLAPRLAPQLAAQGDAFSIRRAIDTEVRQTLADLADYLEQTLGGGSPPHSPSDTEPTDDTDADAEQDDDQAAAARRT